MRWSTTSISLSKIYTNLPLQIYNIWICVWLCMRRALIKIRCYFLTRCTLILWCEWMAQWTNEWLAANAEGGSNNNSNSISAGRKFRPTVTQCRQHRVQIEMFAFGFVNSYLILSRQMIHSMRQCRLVASAGPHTYKRECMSVQFDKNTAFEARGNGFLITRLMAPGIEQRPT